MKVGFLLLDAQVTGGQVVAHALIDGLRAAGHDSVAVFPAGGPMVERLRAEGHEAIVAPLSRSYRLDEAVRLGAALGRAEIDLLDTHTLYVGNQLARVASRLTRLPLIIHSHIDERYHRLSALAAAQRAVERIAQPPSAVTVAVSDYLRQLLLARGADPGRVVTIHNGVRLGAGAPPAAGRPLRLLCVARLAPVKGQEVLLEALRRSGAEISVDFLGDDLEQGGAYRSRLEALAERLGLAARTRFLGARPDVAQRLRAADGLVLPSFAEGFPLVALEAMAEARPVIATAVGGTPEAVLDGETGLLVPSGDPERLGAALLRLSGDPDLRSRLGSAGHARVARLFTTERMVERTITLYKQVLTDARSRPAPASRAPRRDPG